MSRTRGSNFEWLINKPALIGRKGTISSVDTSYKGECEVTFDDKSEVSVSCEDITNGNGAHLLSNCKPPKRRTNYDWLIRGEVLIGRKGIIKDAPRDDSSSDCRVEFDDGTEESICCDDAIRGAFYCLLQRIGLDHQYVWPGTEKFERTNNQQEAPTEAKHPKPAAKRGKNESKKRVSIKLEGDTFNHGDIDADHRIAFKAGSHAVWENREADAADEDITDPEGAFRFIGKRKVALPLQPANMLWHAINCPEAKTGGNMLQEFLCVHDRVPGQDLVRSLWDMFLSSSLLTLVLFVLYLDTQALAAHNKRTKG